MSQVGTGRLVAVATFALLVVWGVAYSFGSFLGPIAQELESATASLAGVFSASAIIYFTVGWPAGRLRDRVGVRRLLISSAVALALGLLAASRVTSVLGLYLSYSLGVGLAVGLVYVPLVSEVVARVDRGNTLAVGVTVSGVGIGTLAGPPVAAALINSLGWRATFTTIGIVGSLLLLACAAGAPKRVVTPQSSVAASHQTLPRIPGFCWLYIAATLMALALYVPFVYLPSFTESLGVDPVRAATSVSVIGASSVVGRFGLAGVATRVGLRRVYMGSYIAVFSSFGVWLVAVSYSHVIAFAVLLGVGYGGFISLTPAVVSQLFSAERVGGVLGLLYTSAAIGTGIGPPVAAVLLDARGGYSVVISACLGVMLLAVATLYTFLRVSPR